MNKLFISKKNELNQKKKKGFTLIELIIVIAVIAILAAVAIPKFGQVKKNSNIAADQANAKIIATAVATAVSNGEVTNNTPKIDATLYSKYIDGGNVPAVKSDDSDWVVKYNDADGVTVMVGDKYMYPADKKSGSGSESGSGSKLKNNQ